MKRVIRILVVLIILTGIGVFGVSYFFGSLRVQGEARAYIDALETCTCIQRVADETLDADIQNMAVAFFAEQTTSHQIAAQHGVAVTQDFLSGLAALMEKSTATCDAP